MIVNQRIWVEVLFEGDPQLLRWVPGRILEIMGPFLYRIVLDSGQEINVFMTTVRSEEEYAKMSLAL